MMQKDKFNPNQSGRKAVRITCSKPLQPRPRKFRSVEDGARCRLSRRVEDMVLDWMATGFFSRLRMAIFHPYRFAANVEMACMYAKALAAERIARAAGGEAPHGA